MNELIQVTERHIGDGTIQTVNARCLHAFLDAIADPVRKLALAARSFATCCRSRRTESQDQRGRPDHGAGRSRQAAHGSAVIYREGYGAEGRCFTRKLMKGLLNEASINPCISTD